MTHSSGNEEITDTQSDYKLMEKGNGSGGALDAVNEDQTGQTATESQSEKKSGCLDAIRNQGTRFCSPHTAVPEEWAEGKMMPLLYGPYGLSSLAYSVLGIWILIAIRGTNTLGTPPVVDGTMLVIQGLVSYGCDVYTFGYSSVFKVMDRCEAVVTFFWWIAKLFYLRQEWYEYVIFIATGIVAVACKMKGEIAMRNLQWMQFLVWHSLWHYTAPIGIFVWAFVRNKY